MSISRAVVLSIDRLGAAWLGPYGNTWLETPNFNRLAAESVLWETAVTDSADLAVVSRSWWTGRHAIQPARSDRALPALVAAAGVESILVTDDSAVADHAVAKDFSRRSVRNLPEAPTCAAQIDETGFFQLTTLAIEELRERPDAKLVWIHTRGMGGRWDAPLEFRRRFKDDDDPDPPTIVEPPNRLLPAAYDPDEVLGYVQAYAGQVVLTDLCLGLLLEALKEDPLADETLLIVTAPRGFPLGEHRRIGPCDEPLYGELLHVPLLARFPDGVSAAVRTQQLAQPHELFSLVRESCGWMADEPETSASAILTELQEGSPRDANQVACAIGRAQRAIRTPGWFLRQWPQEGEATHSELFAKPDDRFEANEVASRCPDIVELLAAELDRFQAAAAIDRLADIAPLAEPLTSLWR